MVHKVFGVLRSKRISAAAHTAGHITALISSAVSRQIHRVYAHIRRWPLLAWAGLAAFVSVAAVSLGILYYQHQLYTLSPAEQRLIRGSTVDHKFIINKDGAISYSRQQDERSRSDKTLTVASSQLDSTGQSPYRARLAAKHSDGITFSDAEQQRQFKLLPLFRAGNARYEEGKVLYPQGRDVSHVFTFRTNGVKEDIVLAKAPGSAVEFSWRLELGGELEARMLANGGVGIYSASSYLFGNLQVSDDESQRLVDNARTKGAKDHLAFVLPAPYIVDAGGTKDYGGVRFALEGNALILRARDMHSRNYPISIDPSIVVSTTADFSTTNQDSGGITYATSDQIGRRADSNGRVGQNDLIHNYDVPRTGMASAVYNGVLYVAGGFQSTVGACSTDSSITYCDDIQIIPIDNNSGLLQGVLVTQEFTTARRDHAVLAHNGFLYIIGGQQSASNGACKDSGTSNRCNDIQRYPINANGSLGALAGTDYFNLPRSYIRPVIYNNTLYISGGQVATASTGTSLATNCKDDAENSANCNDILRYPINADGSIGSLTTTYSFPYPRFAHGMAAYGGYLYIAGGSRATSDTNCKASGTTSLCSDILRYPINADGSLGTLAGTNYMPFDRTRFGMVITNGYLYIVAGSIAASSTTCKTLGITDTRCKDILQYAIKGDGSIGQLIDTTYFLDPPRSDPAVIVHKNSIYMMGGEKSNNSTVCATGAGSFYCRDVQRLQLGVGVGGSPSYFNIERFSPASAVSNGYLYISGGQQPVGGTGTSLSVDCKDNAVSTNRCNDIQRYPINADGTIGAIAGTQSFVHPRSSHKMLAYNGYLYIMGGQRGVGPSTGTSLATDCKDDPTNNDYCNDIQIFPINSDGSLGTALTTQRFDVARIGLGVYAYNGYLYVIGGSRSVTGTGTNLAVDCKNDPANTAGCNDIQIFPINSDGSLGTALTTQTFATPRSSHIIFEHGGDLYIGMGGTNLSDIQRYPINNNGTLGSLTATYNLPYGLSSSGVGIFNGSLYVVGGSGTALRSYCRNTLGSFAACNAVTQYTIAADGSIASESGRSYFMHARVSATSVQHGSMLYHIGGDNNSVTGGEGDCKNNLNANSICNDILGIDLGSARGTPSTQTTANFTTPRQGHASVAYKGYLYTIGGEQSASDTACKNSGSSNVCNDIQRRPINADGTLGSVTTSYFNTPRKKLAATAYGGYLYIVGGEKSASSSACLSGGSGLYCDDIQRMPISASDGSLGSITTSYFNTPRFDHAVVAHKGYLYISGGEHAASDQACVNTGVNNIRCNDIQRAAISASDGSLGSITTSYFNTPRSRHGLTAQGEYLYLVGGYHTANDQACVNTGTNNNYCNDIQYMEVVTNGSLGSISTAYFSTPRADHMALASNGYLYIAGGDTGVSAQACNNTGINNPYCNDIQRIQLPGKLLYLGPGGLSQTSYFSVPRYGADMTGDNSYLYISGGLHNASDQACSSAGSNTIYCNDSLPILTNNPPQRAVYEKIVDIGHVAKRFTGIAYNGSLACGEATIDYRYAGGNAQWGSTATLSQVKPGVAATVAHTDIRYVWLRVTLDEVRCGGGGTLTDISIVYFDPPEAPTLIAPSNGQLGRTTTPTFTLRSADDAGGYVRYKIEVCSTSDCSSIVRTIDQTSSQTGWTGQDADSGNAYVAATTVASSTIASHTYQGPALSLATQYWWRAYAIDPTDTNTWSVASGIYSFTTQYTANAPTLIYPVANATGISTSPEFIMAAAAEDLDNVRYKIEVCSTSDCSSIVRTIDQTSSQTGWSSMNADNGTSYTTGTVYTASQQARHVYQNPVLVANTQYWWRAYTIDPGGLNTWSLASSINTFTTSSQQVVISGGTTIDSGSDLGD